MTRADRLGEWFAGMEESTGENFEFSLVRCRGRDAPPEWFFMEHDAHDGIGGLAHILRKEGSDLVVPQLRGTDRPSWFPMTIAAIRCLFRRYPKILQWKKVDRGWKPHGSREERRPKAVAWSLFSREETQRLHQIAKSQGVSLNSWLLWGLKEAILPHLVPNTGKVEMLLPVNMRGGVDAERDTGSLASTIDVFFPPDTSAVQIHALIREQFKRRAHWGVWQLAAMLMSLGTKIIPYIVKMESQVYKHGSFTNLTDLWSVEAKNGGADNEEWWIGMNPVFRTRPVGTCVLTWCGRLSLSLQLHQSLSRDPEEAAAWMAAWRKAVLPPREDTTYVPALGAAGQAGLLPEAS